MGSGYLLFMNVIVSEPQLSFFLRRRFSPEELDQLIDNIKDLIDDQNTIDISSVYDAIRQFIKKKKFSDIDEFGDDQPYWDSYLKYERPLIAYVKSILNLTI
jgi:hypothetical protein